MANPTILQKLIRAKHKLEKKLREINIIIHRIQKYRKQYPEFNQLNNPQEPENPS